jgi:hypothetical protein
MLVKSTSDPETALDSGHHYLKHLMPQLMPDLAMVEPSNTRRVITMNEIDFMSEYLSFVKVF